MFQITWNEMLSCLADFYDFSVLLAKQAKDYELKTSHFSFERYTSCMNGLLLIEFEKMS